MRALITGGYGFVGRHLAKYLASCGDDVAVTYVPAKSDDPKNPAMQHDKENRVELPRTAQSMALDVTDEAAVSQLVSLIKPDAIYHLAAMSYVPEGEKSLTQVFNVNLGGTHNLLRAIADHSKSTRLLYVGSAEIYGEPRPGTLPLQESAELRPISSYGVSKAAADLLTGKYYHRDGIHTVRVRPFPHIGPGQNPMFAISSFAKQLAEVKLGKREPIIKVGNLEAKRDYSDVLDIARGYREAIENGKPGEAYNLCSGKSIAIGDMLKALIERAGVDVEIQVDPERMRPVDIADMYGSYQKAQRDFGWKPKVEQVGSLDALFGYWLEVVGSRK